MAPQTLETRLLSDDMNDRSTDPMTVPTVARLLDAVEILCAKKAPSNVTMREVATAAGLSLGVAYRYYASREELFGAAMDRMADQIVAAATGDTPITAVTALWRALEDYPAFPRMLTSLVLEGRNVSEVMSRHPLMRDIARSAAEQGIGDPATVAGVTGIMTLAGVLFAPTLNRTIQREPDDPRVYDAAAEMMAIWVKDREAGGSGE
jgi:AcrR family transcriptional regulator